MIVNDKEIIVVTTTYLSFISADKLMITSYLFKTLSTGFTDWLKVRLQWHQYILV